MTNNQIIFLLLGIILKLVDNYYDINLFKDQPIIVLVIHILLILGLIYWFQVSIQHSTALIAIATACYIAGQCDNTYYSMIFGLLIVAFSLKLLRLNKENTNNDENIDENIDENENMKDNKFDNLMAGKNIGKIIIIIGICIIILYEHKTITKEVSFKKLLMRIGILFILLLGLNYRPAMGDYVIQHHYFQDILWNPMSSIDDIGFPKELLQNPSRIRPSDEFLFGFERIIKPDTSLFRTIENISKLVNEILQDEFIKDGIYLLLGYGIVSIIQITYSLSSINNIQNYHVAQNHKIENGHLENGHLENGHSQFPLERIRKDNTF